MPKELDGTQDQEKNIGEEFDLDEELKDDDLDSELDLDVKDDIDEEEDDVEGNDDELSDKRLKTAIAQKRRYRDKYKEREEKIKLLEKENEELKKRGAVKESKDDVKNDDVNSLITHEDYTDIKLEHPYLQREDIEKAARWAKVEGISVHEVLKQGFFKSYAEEKYQEDISKSAVPSPSNRTGSAASATLRKLAENPQAFHKLSKSQKEKVRKLLNNR